MTQEEVIKKVTGAFDKHNILYMLIGGIAVNYYGRPRFTHDVDMIIQIQLKNAQEIISLFEREFYVAIEGVIEAIQYGTMFNLIHQETGFKVDCWVLKDEEYAKVSFARRRKEIIFDQPIYISSPEDLIISKLDWYKKSDIQKHYEDALSIFQIQAENLDLDYIKDWAECFSFLEILKEIIKKCS
jgi:hypothetical protein